MNPARWERIDRLFQEALERPDADRSAFVDATCADDSELHREVLSLLKAHARSSSRLDAPAHGGVSRLLDLDPALAVEDLIGARLGAYRITRAIAAGGMGAVYLAVRDDDVYQKTVAIKLVRRSALGSSASRRQELRQRFQIERQALASLDHPFIARLIDGGDSDDGRPYFVLEFVEGRAIDEYCEQEQLSVPDRIRLFCRVCEAVEHAHQRLILHRDLKPANILVTADGAPKLLDFGLAKLLEPHLSAQTAGITVTGEFMGTFAYAAPEQIAPTGHAPDTRSDVYALGMVLYRLLTNHHAYDISGIVADVIQRITTQDPRPPSSANRAIGNELDTIVLKALAKGPSRRYQSAGALGEDLNRYLSGQPIHAKADSGWYILRKTVIRYRALVAIAAAVFVVAIGVGIMTTMQAQALAERSRATAAALHESNIERGRLIGVSGNVALAERVLWGEYLRNNADPLSHWALWELYADHPCRRSLSLGMSVGEVLTGESSRVVMLDLGGRRVALLDGDSDPVLFDLGEAEVIASALSPDGMQLAQALGAGGVQVVDLTGDLRAPTSRLLNSGAAERLTFSADGALLATTAGGVLQIIRIADGAIIFDLADASAGAIQFSPLGDALIAACSDGAVRSWNIDTGALSCSWPVSGLEPLVLALSSEGHFAAVRVEGTSVRLLDLRTGSITQPSAQPKGWIRTLEFHPHAANPRMLLSASADETVRIWSVPSGKLLREFRGHSAPLADASFARDGHTLITADSIGGVRMWDVQLGAEETSWDAPSRTVFNISASPDGTRVAACLDADESAMLLLSARDGSTLRRIEGGGQAFSSAVFSADGRRLATARYGGEISVYDARDLEVPPVRATPHRANANSVSFAPDGEWLASGGDDGRVLLLDPVDLEVYRSVTFPNARVPSVAWSPAGPWVAVLTMAPIASGATSYQLIMVELLTRTVHTIAQGEDEQALRVVRFNRDGSLLAAAGDDGAVRVWRVGKLPNATFVARLTGHAQGLFALAFSPTDDLLASAGRGGEIRLWDTRSATPLATLRGHTDMVFGLTFLNDASTLVSCGRGGHVGIWNLRHFDSHIEANREFVRSALGIVDNAVPSEVAPRN